MDLPDYVPKKSYSVDVLATLPTAFDSREQWPDCIHPILNQGNCGSCWAFGTSETLSDRLCIASNGTQNVVLSPQDLVDCSLNMGCNGGYPYSAWLWMEWDGVASLDCVPYVSGNTDAEAACTSTCTDNSTPKDKFYTEKLSVSALITANDIMADLYAHGPVESAFLVYEDFMNYQSGVYVHQTGDYLGGHCIKIVGWGAQDGLNYWIVANSWGTDWGLDGFFWIEWGQGTIDLNGMAGLPNLSSQ
jgi:cathepsin B